MSRDDLTLPAGLVERLSQVRSVGVITGAGVSAESGIPTYRGAGGIYDDPEDVMRALHHFRHRYHYTHHKRYCD